MSVCIPAYQAERYLAATIESVLHQTYPDWELVILDNASEDRTAEIARSYADPRIRVATNPTTLPLADNWNAVAGLAQGTYLKILCADDVLAPECLAREVAALDANPDMVMVASRRDFISSAGEVVLRERGLTGLLGPNEPAEVVGRVVRSGINPIGWPSALLVRRADFVAVGGFDRRWFHSMDLDLWLRLLSRGGLFGLAETLASFRVSDSSLTAQLKDPGAQYRAMIRAFLETSPWPIGRLALARGMARSRLEEVRLRLLFRAVNHRLGIVRRLPAAVLRRSANDEGRGVLAEIDGWSGPHTVGPVARGFGGGALAIDPGPARESGATRPRATGAGGRALS